MLLKFICANPGRIIGFWGKTVGPPAVNPEMFNDPEMFITTSLLTSVMVMEIAALELKEQAKMLAKRRAGSFGIRIGFQGFNPWRAAS